MRKTELRIGNFLQGKDSHVIVQAILSNGLIKIEGNPSVFYIENQNPCLEQIPLTEEWLLNFGAKEILPKRGVFKEFVLKTVRLEMSHNGNFYYKNSKLILEYVHQLQNLYFALKNEELTFKSE